MQTRRDSQILSWIGRLGAAGAEHVMDRFAMGRSWAYARLGVLVADGLLDKKTLLYRQPGLYLATASGLRWSGLEDMPVYRIGPGGFQHAREVAAVAVALHHALPGWQLLGEREIRALERHEGALIASAKLGQSAGGREALHRPDLAVISPSGRCVAVEVELSVKAPRRLEAICRGWARARHIDSVYYLATPAPARALARAVTEVRAEDRIRVLAVGDTAGLAEIEGRELSDVGH